MEAMTTNAARLGVVGVLLWTTGCGGDGEACPDLGGEPAITEFTVTPATVAAGDAVDVTVDGEHLGDLMPTSDGTDMDMEHEEESACPGGHLHVYLDDLDSNPLTMQEAKAFPMDIPADTPVGPHTLIVRLHNKDHTIYEPQVTMEAQITVE